MTDNPVCALVVDDEPPIRRLLKRSLTAHHYRVIEAENGSDALDMVALKNPDVVILDLGLPDIDGIEVIRRLRVTSHVPIVVLSARGEVRAKVDALELGADDYVTKPFAMEELIARLHAARRHRFLEKGEQPVFRSGDLMVDLVRRRITFAGKEVKLSPTEFALLQLFVTHAGMALTHHQISRDVWGTTKDVQYVRVYIRQLRKKIEANTQTPCHIVTEPGVGYRLQIED
jgi:two-component system KDP operon response regulator KdpE